MAFGPSIVALRAWPMFELSLGGLPLMTVKLVESHGHALAIEGAEPTRYGLGPSGWVNVPLHAKGVTLDLLRDWIEESYRIVAPKRLVAELDRR